MAIVSHRGLTKTVADLAERDAITPKIDGMVVTVNSSVGDPIAGSGEAVYKWIMSSNEWLLLADDDAVTFTQVEKDKLSNIEENATAAGVNTLGELSDVNTSGVTTDSIIKYNGTNWVIGTDQGGSTISWGDISGTLSNQTDLQTELNTKLTASINTPLLGNTITYNGTAWVNAMQDAQYVNIIDTAGHYTAGNVETALAEVPTLIDNGITTASIKDLADVYSTMTPTDGQMLTYDSTNGWQAETLTNLPGSLTVGTDLTVTGDLTVQGTNFIINTDTINLGNNFLVLNTEETGSPTLDCGIEVERGTASNVKFQWNETNDEWELTNDGTNFYQIMSGDNFLTEPAGTGASGWNDITAEVIVRGAQSAAPTWDEMGSTGMWGYNFGIDKSAFANFHIRHDYMPGGDIFIHVHWTTSGTDTNTVKWEFEYTAAKGHNQSTNGNFFPTTSTTVEQAASGTAWRHMVTEMSTSIPLTNIEVDSIIMLKLTRVSNGGTDNSDDIFGITVDLHYQTDRISTINRAPNFYGA